MSAIEKAAAMLREEAEAIKAMHTLRGDWCGDPVEADYHEMIAVADAAVAERDELMAALQRIADGQAVERHDRCTHPSGPHPMNEWCAWRTPKTEGIAK